MVQIRLSGPLPQNLMNRILLSILASVFCVGSAVVADFRVVDEISPTISEYLAVFNPEINQFAFDSRIQVKGVNRYRTEVFVNGKPVRVRSDGRFFYDLDLVKAGKQNVYVTFRLPDSQLYTVRRKVNRLNSPAEMAKFPNSRQDIILFYNSDFYRSHRSLSSDLTRADLAHFFAVLFNVDPKNAIKHALDRRYMSEFPDGSFRPDANVKRIEYVVTLVNALQLKPDVSGPGNWTEKFIRTAQKNNLISDLGDPNKDLTVAEFIGFVSRLPQYKEKLSYGLSFDRGFEDVQAPQIVRQGKVTRAELAGILTETFQIPEFVGPVKKHMTSLSQYGIFSEDAAPDQKVSRAEALTAIVRVCRGTGSVSSKNLPYWDVSKKHWVYPYLDRAYCLKLVMPARHFNPNRDITHAELAMMLSRAPKQ